MAPITVDGQAFVLIFVVEKLKHALGRGYMMETCLLVYPPVLIEERGLLGPRFPGSDMEEGHERLAEHLEADNFGVSPALKGSWPEPC